MRLTKNYGLSLRSQSIQCAKTPEEAALAAARKKQPKKPIQLIPTAPTGEALPSGQITASRSHDPRYVPSATELETERLQSAGLNRLAQLGIRLD